MFCNAAFCAAANTVSQERKAEQATCMRRYNLQCPFPASDMAVFTSLTTLNLGRNPNMTVRLPSANLYRIGLV